MSGHELLKVVRERRGASIASRIPVSPTTTTTTVTPTMTTPELVVMLPETEADVAQIEYLKIVGCYVLDREGDVVDELKRLVDKVVL